MNTYTHVRQVWCFSCVVTTITLGGCMLFDRFATYEDEFNVHRQLSVPVDAYEFVYIPGGCFEMGAPSEFRDEVSGIIRDDRLELSRPRHIECVPPFHIGKYEITAKQYCLFLGELAENEDPGSYVVVDRREARTTIELRDGVYVPRQGFEFAPATCVTYVGARRFCDWLSSSGNAVYRLPSEIEWEYVAHGLEERSVAVATNLQSVPVYLRTRYMQLAPWSDSPGVITVGNHPETATVQGVHDMMGNAMEWCGNVYFQYPSGEKVWNGKDIRRFATPPILSMQENRGEQLDSVRRGYIFVESDLKLPPLSSLWVRIRSRESDRKEEKYNTGFRVLRESKEK